MSDLADKKCIPCKGGIPGFNISEIHKYLKMVDGWEVKTDESNIYYLIKEFKFIILMLLVINKTSNYNILINKRA